MALLSSNPAKAVKTNEPTTMFTSGQELAILPVSSGLLHRPWAAILQLYRDTNNNDDPTLPFSIRYSVDQHPSNGSTIIAFVSSPPFTAQHLEGGGRDFVSSATLRERFPLFEFVSTKGNPSFSIHRVAVTLFESVWDELSSLKDKYGNISSPLIVAGHSVGGSIASLFTLLLLESISAKTTSRPLCITFGSPLIGDNGFQQAISERPAWNSCFLHVVSNQDPIPILFASPPSGLTVASSSHATSHTYKPFGTFLFCSELGCACFEEPETIVDLMVANCSDSVGNRGSNEVLQIIPYGDILKKLERRALCREISELGDWNFSPLQTGFFLQIEAIKGRREQRRHHDYGDVNSGLITKIVKRSEDLLARNKNVFDRNKKLNEMKIHMAHIEWFKKYSEARGGYYDVFKIEHSKPREEIVKKKSILTQYWEKLVKEVEKKPQKEGANLSTRWLYAGTNYRRMVEPLDIAEWYKKGERDYVAAGRSEHYKRLEQWVKDDQETQQISTANERKRGCSLTEDSCFWANVEEAIISCELIKLKDVVTCPEDRKSSTENLLKFENYVMEMIRNQAVAPEIYLKQSSFMHWWATYEKIIGTSYHSPLVDHMRNRG